MRIAQFAIFPLLFIISCSSNPGKIKTVADSPKKDSAQKISVNNPDSISQKKNPEWPAILPIDINALKKQYGAEGLLSSIVPKSKINSTCDDDSVKGFFGEYYFLDSISKKNFDLKNTLTVFKPGRPEKWRMEATDERFWSINLKNPSIKLWDTLHVGMRIDDFPFPLIHQGEEPENTSSIYINGFGIECKDEKGIITEINVQLQCGNVPGQRN
jgi:hypothetical protein